MLLADVTCLCSLPLMTQLFGHVADRLGHVRNAVCEVLQHRYDYLTRFPDEFGPDSVNKLSRQIESLQPVITYIEQVGYLNKRLNFFLRTDSLKYVLLTVSQNNFAYFSTLFPLRPSGNLTR